MAGDEAVAGGPECCYYTTDDALSHVGFGRFQALVLAYAGVGWTAEAMEIMLLSFVGPSVKDEWGISAQQEGLVTSVVFAGMIIGACLGGVISDSYGRRAGFLFTAVVTGIFGFLSALSPNYICLLTLRFVVGMGLGAGHVLGTWFFEFVPAAKRGTWVVVFHCTWTFGTIFQALIAWAIMPVLGWRWLIALSSSPCFVLLIFYGVTPESPRYLCSRGRTADAKLILERIARMNNMSLPSGILIPQKVSDNGVDVETILPLITSQDSDATDMSISTKSSFTNAFRTLVSRSLIRSTLLLWFVYFAFSFAYYGIVLLTSELSNGERRCAPVGMPLRQQNDVRLYRDVLVTSIADLPHIMSKHRSGSRDFGRPDRWHGCTTHSSWFVRELPSERSGVRLRYGTLPCSSGLCPLSSGDQRLPDPLLLSARWTLNVGEVIVQLNSRMTALRRVGVMEGRTTQGSYRMTQVTPGQAEVMILLGILIGTPTELHANPGGMMIIGGIMISALKIMTEAILELLGQIGNQGLTLTIILQSVIAHLIDHMVIGKMMTASMEANLLSESRGVRIRKNRSLHAMEQSMTEMLILRGKHTLPEGIQKRKTRKSSSRRMA